MTRLIAIPAWAVAVPLTFALAGVVWFSIALSEARENLARTETQANECRPVAKQCDQQLTQCWANVSRIDLELKAINEELKQ